MNTITRSLSALVPVAALAVGTVALASPSAALDHGQQKHTIELARKLGGTPYAYGGKTPSSGFDCAGFTKYVFKKTANARLGSTAGTQAGSGISIKDKRAKRKGDLIVFYNGSTAYHTGIYAGKGKVFHASRPGETVHAEKIWTSSYKVRRLG